MAADTDPIALSALQHTLYCPRQCALIHVEQAWAENRFTAEGRVLHERTAEAGHETRRGVRVVTALAIASRALGVSGIADLVELHPRPGGGWRPYPVEYKRGKPKAHRADEVQLAAQAICLEEMFGVEVPEGALFYGATAVAPHAGARIETSLSCACRGRGRVAPHAGARIETGEYPQTSGPIQSPLTQGRGLKREERG